MDKIIFTCKTITPLVMNGAYGEHPELRPPGIKASLRFWWRALHGHLPLDDLRKQEAEIFGSTKGRSKVLIRIEEQLEEQINSRTYLLPHKQTEREKSPVPAFIPELTCKVRINCGCNSAQKDMLKNLFILACTLGGWGKRSRRGFGSVAVSEVDGFPYSSPIDLQGILNCINSIVPGRYSIQSNAIKPVSLISKQKAEDYPFVLEIKVGTETTTLARIGQVTHDVKAGNSSEYSKSLGDGRPRLASPVYVSILANDIPVITTLKKDPWVNAELQNSLKSKILNA